MADLIEPFAGDVAEIAADRLIRHFGTLAHALAATPEQLASALEGNRRLAASIVAARTLFEAGLRERVSREAVSVSNPAFRKYLRFLIGGSATERLHATFLARDCGYIADEQIADGTTGEVQANLRRLLGRAFDLGAHGIILAHNHPSQSAEPSVDDIALTRTIAQLTKSVGIQLLDHLIVGGKDIVSMRQRGLI